MFERWAELQGAQGQESREPDVKALKLNAAPVVGWRRMLGNAKNVKMLGLR